MKKIWIKAELTLSITGRMIINEKNGVPVAVLQNVKTKVTHLELRNSPGLTADSLRIVANFFNQILKYVIQKQIAKLIPKMVESELNHHLSLLSKDFKIGSNYFPFTMRPRLMSSPVVTEESLKIYLSFKIGECYFSYTFKNLINTFH